MNLSRAFISHTSWYISKQRKTYAYNLHHPTEILKSAHLKMPILHNAITDQTKNNGLVTRCLFDGKQLNKRGADYNYIESLNLWELKTVTFGNFTRNIEFYSFTLSWRRPLSYRNQSIDLLRKSMDCFLYDNGLRQEIV